MRSKGHVFIMCADSKLMNISETFLWVSLEWWATFTTSSQNNGNGALVSLIKVFRKALFTSQSRAEADA